MLFLSIFIIATCKWIHTDTKTQRIRYQKVSMLNLIFCQLRDTNLLSAMPANYFPNSPYRHSSLIFSFTHCSIPVHGFLITRKFIITIVSRNRLLILLKLLRAGKSLLLIPITATYRIELRSKINRGTFHVTIFFCNTKIIKYK